MQDDKPIVRIAYREAGHATMYCLLSKGIAAKHVPYSRSDMLPVVEKVSIIELGNRWGGFTANLGSMITVAQVLLAGYVAQRIKFPDTMSHNDHPLIAKPQSLLSAEHFISAYLDEYARDLSIEENAKATNENIENLTQYVEQQLIHNWSTVEKLVDNLLKQKTIPMLLVLRMFANE
jgi:hypothetical protein